MTSAQGTRRERGRLADRRPDDRPDDDVARVVHARVHARVGDCRGQAAQHCAEHRHRPCHGPCERERRRRVARREGGGGRHRYVPPLRHTRRVAVRTLPPARQLHRQIHDGRVDAHRDEPCRRRPSPSWSPEREQCRRGHEPQLRVVRQSGEAAKRPVERGRRCAGDRSVDGKVDLGELVQCLGGDRSPGRRGGPPSPPRAVLPAGPASLGRARRSLGDRTEGGRPQQAQGLPPAESGQRASSRWPASGSRTRTGDSRIETRSELVDGDG